MVPHDDIDPLRIVGNAPLKVRSSVAGNIIARTRIVFAAKCVIDVGITPIAKLTEGHDRGTLR